MTGPRQPHLRDVLTEKERRVLILVATGLQNPEIGAELWVAEQTVKFHLGNIYRKLGVKTRTAAVWRGLELGIITPPPVNAQHTFV